MRMRERAKMMIRPAYVVLFIKLLLKTRKIHLIIDHKG
jgi:hypothetical protein